MPFTLAHPFVVLPLRSVWRQGFVGLVIGRIGPDIPYFLPADAIWGWPSTHTPLGALTAGATLAMLFLMIVVMLRPVLVEPLWGRSRQFLDRELGAFSDSPWMCLQALPAVVIGSGLHFATDAATHRGWWIVEHVTALRAELPVGFGAAVPVYHALQYLFSVLGLGVLAWWYQHEVRAIVPDAACNRAQRPRLLTALCVASVIIGVFTAVTAGDGYESVHGRIFQMTTMTVRTWLALYALLGAVLLLMQPRSAR